MTDKLFGVIPRQTLNNPDSAEERIKNDPYLTRVFSDEIQLIRFRVDKNAKCIVEIGAAGGNTKLIWPEVITTDVRAASGVDKVMSGEKFDFSDSSVDVVIGLDALHHLRSPQQHFNELLRVLKPGGKVFYIEPNWNLFSKICFKIILKYLHPEPYDTNALKWDLTSDDPMMGNQAQAFNIFVRDKNIFSELFPQFKVEMLEPTKAISFLLSGGVHTRLPIPGKFLLWIYENEGKNRNWMNTFSLGRLILLTKN